MPEAVTAVEEVEQKHLAPQHLEIHKKHDVKLRDSANKMEELPKLLPAQPPLLKPGHITPATGGTPAATKNTTHNCKASINYNSVEKATTEKNKKMPGHLDYLQMKIHRSIEIVLRKRLSKPEKLLGSLVDQPPPLRTAHTVMTTSKGSGSLVHSNSGDSSTLLSLIGSKVFPICKGRDPRGGCINCEPHIDLNPTLRQQLLGVSTQQSARKGLTDDMGGSYKQHHKGPVGNNQARVEDLRVQELIQDLSLVEVGRGASL